MAMKKKFSWKQRLDSFRYAGAGISYLIKSQHNAWLHITITVMVLLSAILLKITRLEWCLITMAIAGVLAVEAMNTAIEKLADALHPDQHPLVGTAKDIAAGAVLLA
ncbi:diacylglycerol kinase family protein, partial [bacterium]|nr:diacylglycerol kinase family protein [bacterium]